MKASLLSRRPRAELKTQALALQAAAPSHHALGQTTLASMIVIGGVVNSKYDGYRLIDQWTSYGWNVFTIADGHDYDQIVSVLKAMEEWDPTDRRPMIAIGKTIKGYWPCASNGQISESCRQLISYASHPYAMKMNSDYFVALAQTFEERYGVEFSGIRQGPVRSSKG